MMAKADGSLVGGHGTCHRDMRRGPESGERRVPYRLERLGMLIRYGVAGRQLAMLEGAD